MMSKLSLKRNDNAISPVIGTILMVAATVIIAGAVYAAVNAYNGKTAKPAPDAAFKATTVDTDGDGLEDMIKVTYISGPSGSSGDANVTSTAGIWTLPGSDHTTWSPGDYETFDPTSGAATYFVTVKMGDNTVLDQTLTLKE